MDDCDDRADSCGRQRGAAQKWFYVVKPAEGGEGHVMEWLTSAGTVAGIGALVVSVLGLARWALIAGISLWSLRADAAGRRHALAVLRLLCSQRGLPSVTSRVPQPRTPEASPELGSAAPDRASK